MYNTIFILGLMTLIFVFIGWFFFGFLGTTIALILAIIMNLAIYWYSDRVIIKMSGAKPSDNEEIEKIVSELSRDAGILVPKIYSIPKDIPNAFATGRNSQHAAVVYTKGLLRLNRDEIKAVMAHELMHISSRHILIGTVAAVVAGAISYLAQIGYWSLFLGGDERNQSNIIGLILIIVFAPLAALLLRMAISRKNEFEADRRGAILCKDPNALASALRNIDRMSKLKPFQGGSAATSHLWIVNPFKRDWFSNLFSTHPPIEERIRVLVRMGS